MMPAARELCVYFCIVSLSGLAFLIDKWKGMELHGEDQCNNYNDNEGAERESVLFTEHLF